MSKVLISVSTLQHEQEYAESAVRAALATLRAAEAHLAYVTNRNRSLGNVENVVPIEENVVPTEAPVRAPEQSTRVLRALREPSSDGGGLHKIDAIKVVRKFTGLGLKEAKDLVEALPHRFVLGDLHQPPPVVASDQLDHFAKRLAAVGCTIAWEP